MSYLDFCEETDADDIGLRNLLLKEQGSRQDEEQRKRKEAKSFGGCKEVNKVKEVNEVSDLPSRIKLTHTNSNS